MTEGDSGQKMMNFVVSAYDTYGEIRPLAFSYKTIDRTAIAGEDYIATSGESSVTTGSGTTTISVPIIGDTLPEADETFTFQVTAFARYSVVEKTGTIVNDDTPPPTSTPVGAATPTSTPTA
ncbi:hypothetical protein EON83_26420 [bacterium]|nr:MAG: hypothetical protein EON83_26420 [bacterium]